MPTSLCRSQTDRPAMLLITVNFRFLSTKNRALRAGDALLPMHPSGLASRAEAARDARMGVENAVEALPRSGRLVGGAVPAVRGQPPLTFRLSVEACGGFGRRTAGPLLPAALPQARSSTDSFTSQRRRRRHRLWCARALPRWSGAPRCRPAAALPCSDAHQCRPAAHPVDPATPLKRGNKVGAV